MLNKEKIASAEIFKGLSEEGLEEIGKLCEEVIFDHGDRVLAEGHSAEYFLSWKRGVWVSFQAKSRFQPNTGASSNTILSIQ